MVRLALGLVGLYGVMAYVVSLRAREFGIRIALGATPVGIAAATTRQRLRIAIVGFVGGLVLFSLGAPVMRTFIFAVAPWDPISLVGSCAILLAMAAFASWFPARRAGRVDPASALTSE